MVTAPSAPGVYADIPDSVYHGDRKSLSSTGARLLLPPNCPADFRYSQDTPRKSTKAFDLGHAAHAFVLGAGADIVIIDAADYKTKKAQQERDQAYTDGNIPLLPHELAQVKAMAAAVQRHETASALLSEGQPELSLYWNDPDTGVRLRARPDWCPPFEQSGRLIVVDYKTSTTSEPVAFGKKAAEYGYHRQAPWYLDGIVELGIADDPAFVFVVQSKNPPYVVSVVELGADAVRLGRRLNRRAIQVYADCVAAGQWPGWGNDITLVDIPTWAHYQQEEILSV